MTRTLRPGVDRVVRTAPLGVQFRDVLDRRVVSDGLRVDLLDAQNPDRPLRLNASPSGVFVAHALPGMNRFGEEDVTSPVIAVEKRFSLLVRDPLGRYVEASVALALPSDGLFEPACMQGSPPDGLPHVPLYSAPTRPLPAALAVVRADLRLASDEARPASWARLELWLAAVRLATGVADANGAVLLLVSAARAARADAPRVAASRLRAHGLGRVAPGLLERRAPRPARAGPVRRACAAGRRPAARTRAGDAAGRVAAARGATADCRGDRFIVSLRRGLNRSEASLKETVHA